MGCSVNDDYDDWESMIIYILYQLKVGAQFWSAYMGCESQDKDAVQLFLEQVLIIIIILTIIIKIIIIIISIIIVIIIIIKRWM